MASFAGLSLRSAGERADARGAAEGELGDIEEGEREFLKAVEAWAKKHPGARDAISDYLGDFLVDYFDSRRRDAAEELGEDEAAYFDEQRERMIGMLVAGQPL